MDQQPTHRSAAYSSRRRFIFTAGSAAAIGGMPGTGWAQAGRGVSGEIAFASFEWTLPHTGSVLRQITKSFVEKNPRASVREIPIPSSGFHDQILTQLTAGAPPDIFRIDDPQLALYLGRDYLLPLDKALADAGIDKSKFAAAGRDAQKGGETFAVVYQTNARQLIYNKALLADGGVGAVPRDAATLEAAIKATTKRDKGVFGYTFSSKAGEVTSLFMTLGPIIHGFGANFTNAQGQPTANDPKMVEALAFIKRIWDANCVPRGLDAVAANRLVFDGKVALTLNGPFVFGASNKEVRPHLSAVASPLPSGNILRVSSWYGVARRGKNPEAATAWLMHMLAAENQARIAEVERVVPALPGLIPASIFAQDPWFQTFVSGAESGRSYLPPGLGADAFSQIKIIGEELERVLYRDKNVTVAMNDLQRSLEASIAAARR